MVNLPLRKWPKQISKVNAIKVIYYCRIIDENLNSDSIEDHLESSSAGPEESLQSEAAANFSTASNFATETLVRFKNVKKTAAKAIRKKLDKATSSVSNPFKR